MKHPGQETQAGFGRKTSEISGTWKQYSVSESLRIFPAGSGGIRLFTDFEIIDLGLINVITYNVGDNERMLLITIYCFFVMHLFVL